MIETANNGATRDGLEHAALADAVVAYLETLPEGSVLAIQGPWGRGKTDVLGRVHATFVERREAGGSPEPLWLNPWQYGTPNLIAPLVVALLARLEPSARTPRMRLAAQTLLRAGNAIAFKALSVVVPFGRCCRQASNRSTTSLTSCSTGPPRAMDRISTPLSRWPLDSASSSPTTWRRSRPMIPS